MKRSIILSFIFAILLVSFLYSQIPQTISYQGVLTNASGNPVPDGSYNLGFKLYASLTGGTALWSENQSKTITNGVVDVILGSVNSLNLAFDRTYWLGISINQGAELSPRIQLTASAYSLNARTVPDASLTAVKIASGQVVKSLNNLKDNVTLAEGSNVKITPNGNTLTISATTNGGGGTLDQAYDYGGPGAGRKIIADAGAVWISGTGESQGLVVDGKLGIGVANPLAKLDVQYWPAKQLRLKGIGSKGYWNVFHNADQGNDYGFSIADSVGTEWFALNRLSYKNSIYLKGNVGIGTYDPKGDLHIYSTGDPKFRFTNGKGKEATLVHNTDTNGLEFRMGGTGTDPKFFIGDGGNVGVGTVNPTEKFQVAGIIHSTTGGIKFPDGSVQTQAWKDGPIPNNSITSAHIKDGTIQGVDINTSTTITVGKLQAGGTTSSTISVYGKSSGIGVKGENGPKYGYLGTSQYGAFGSSGSGKYGYLGSDNYGVYGYAAGDYAGYFYGNVHVHGRLTKSTGSFKIDHPLDPENKYLYHSFVESPDMMNIYNGNIVLDAKGEATVELPDWFDALNRDFRYQLTAIGAPGPNLYIVEEISNNRFKIAGGTAGMKVSWQVTGIRQDAYANAHRIPVEEMKKGEERGKYLNPEVFNQPESKGIDYAERQKVEQEIE